MACHIKSRTHVRLSHAAGERRPAPPSLTRRVAQRRVWLNAQAVSLSTYGTSGALSVKKCDTKCRLYAVLPSASAAVAYLEPRTSAKFCCRCESAGRRPVGLPLLSSLPATDHHEQTSAADTTDTRPVVGAA